MKAPFTTELDEVNGKLEATITILDDRGGDGDLRVEIIEDDVYLIQEHDDSKDLILISYNMLEALADSLTKPEGLHNGQRFTIREEEN